MIKAGTQKILVARVLLCLAVLLAAQAYAQDVQATDPNRIADYAARVLRTQALAELRPAAIVDQIGRDPFKLFDFVRDEIKFQAYNGVLRGAEGTLAAKAGNAWDQAVLLKTLLDRAGVISIILRVRLENDQAETLIALTNKDSGQMADMFKSEDLSLFDLDKHKYEIATAKRDTAIKDLLEIVSRRSTADIAAIEKAGSLAEPSPDLVSVTRDYVWVQAEIDGRPYDFHPAFPEGKQPVLLPAGVMNYVTSIPAKLFHWVRVRLFLERLTDTGLDRTAILDKQVLPAISAGASARIALRPRELEGNFIRLDPAIAIGDTLYTGKGATVIASEGKALPGSATALWLEVTLLSPGEPPRTATLTLADAFGDDRKRLWDETAQIDIFPLSRSAFGLSVEMQFVTGKIPAARWSETLAISLRRLANAAIRKITIASNGLFGLVPDNPLLTSWGSLQSKAIKGAYLDAPSVAAIVYQSNANGLSAQGRVLFSRYLDSQTRRRKPQVSIASSRLLEALVERRGGKVLTASDYNLHQNGEFTDWSVASQLELEDNKAKKHLLWLPVEEKNHWWSEEPSGAMTLYGQGGWSILLPSGEGAPAPDQLLSGELARLSQDIPNDNLTPEHAKIALQVFIKYYVSEELSPIGPALELFGTAKSQEPQNR